VEVHATPNHRGQVGRVRRSFVIGIFTVILRVNFNIYGSPTTWRLPTEVLTCTTIPWIHELSLIRITSHGKVNIFLEKPNDTIDENHTFLKNSRELRMNTFDKFSLD